MDTMLSLLQSQLQRPRNRLLLAGLAAIGSLWTARQLNNLINFVHLHFWRRGTLQRLCQTDASGAPWALITGASDGIGKGFAQELCQQGFNIILHGRNEEKLENVKAELTQQWPGRSIEIFILDASTTPTDVQALQAAATRFSHLNLRLLINNVTGAPYPLFEPFANRSAAELAGAISASIPFPTHLTRVFLPQLIQHQPSSIMDIGSGSTEMPTPYISYFSGAKAYDKVWSQALGRELKLEGHDVEVMHFLVGMVATNTPADRKPSFFIPTARVFARYCLRMVGSGRRVVWPYWPHAVQLDWVVGILPEWMMERSMMSIVKKMKANEAAASVKAAS